MRVGIFFVHVMRIVGANHFYIKLLCETNQNFVHFYLVGNIMSLQLDVIIFAKKIQPPFEGFSRFVFAFVQNQLRHFCTDATSGRYQTFVVLQNEFFVNPRIFSVHSFYKTERTKFGQIFIALGIFCQKQLMMTFVAEFF